MTDWFCKRGHPVPSPSPMLSSFGRVWCRTCEAYIVPITEHELRVLREPMKGHPSNLDAGRVVGVAAYDIVCPSCGSHVNLRIEKVSTQLAPLPEPSVEEKAQLRVSAESIIPS